jgi:hypothetical protein
MRIIGPEDVQRLLSATGPDAALIVRAGECTVQPAGRVANPRDGVIIARRSDLAAMLPEGDTTPEAIERLAHCLDNAARDRSG